MNTLNWIFLGLSALSLLLYIISLIKKIEILNKISSILLIAFLGTLNTLFLLNKLPDSFNTVIFSITTYVLLTTAYLLSTLKENKLLKKVILFIFFTNNILWLSFYKSIFYIFRIPTLLFVFVCLCYITLSTFSFIKIGKQKLNFYFYSFLELVPCFCLNFCSIISLIFGRTLNSLVLFLGTSANIALVIFYIFNIKKSYKYERPIKYLSLLAAQLLISYSNVILFY